MKRVFYYKWFNVPLQTRLVQTPRKNTEKAALLHERGQLRGFG